MKQQFINIRFQGKLLEIIADANKVIEDYAKQGLTLTVRQLYYRFIAFDLFPDSWIDEKYNLANHLDKSTKNTQKNYKRLADALNKGRLAGLINWKAIEDRTRWLHDYATYDDPGQRLRGLEYSYIEDVWRDQDNYCEVWVEKDALAGVIEGPCNELRVPYFPTRGYMSQSEAYEAGQRIQHKANVEGKIVTIFHLGDHDPSGLDMSRDNEERLLMFGRQGSIDFRRLALNMDQVEQYNPPPNPAKETDSRFAGYEDLYGDESWELDALEPKVIAELVRTNVEALIDRAKFDVNLAEEAENRAKLVKLARNWTYVEAVLSHVNNGDIA